MLKVQGIINDREIIYLDLNNKLEEFEQMELESWVLFVIADNVDHPLLDQFAELSVDKNLLYMCAVGEACSQVDDLFDFVLVGREANRQRMPYWYQSDEDVLMTTWHHDFAEGYWFVTTQARYEDFPIKTVLVANFTGKDYSREIQQLTHQIRVGWLPPD